MKAQELVAAFQAPAAAVGVGVCVKQEPEDTPAPQAIAGANLGWNAPPTVKL